MLAFQALGGDLNTIGLLCVGFGVLLVCFGLGWRIVRASKRNTSNKQTDKSSWGAAKRRNVWTDTDSGVSTESNHRAEDGTSADGGVSNDTGDFVFTDEESDEGDFVFTEENDDCDDSDDSDNAGSQRSWRD